jgi:hypothetical protein
MADGAVVVGAVGAVGVAVAGDVPARKDIQSEERSNKDGTEHCKQETMHQVEER